jgi:Zn-dependent protease with chaperone function
MNTYYPPQPQIADYSFLNPSKSFAKNVKNVLLSILLFFITYLILVALAFGLLYACLWIGIGILTLRLHWITLALGGGVICLGLMFLAFLLKFVFSVQKDSNTNRVEITAEEHPRLFEFINQLVTEVKSPSPKKVFIVPNVNAAVFYNSSFWSMFFPVRKNLEIGLGLVNSVNMSEFKAVLAHEFGHFSQRSMKIGSYVYTVNRAIYNMVYEYDKWDELLDNWAASGGIFSVFAGITRFMVNNIRALLRKAYEFINIRYMGLSREMEYNADLIAVSAAGNASMNSALRRISFGDEAYNRVIDQLNFLIEKQKRTDNVYEKQSVMIDYMAKEKGLDTQKDLPVLTDHYMQMTAPKNRVYFKDQWSSHPEQKDREENINSVSIQAEINEDSPWILFNNPEKLQKELTAQLYKDVQENAEKPNEFINKAAFITSIDERREQYKYPEIFKHFYDGRFLFDIEIEKLDGGIEALTVAHVFNEENRKLLDAYYQNLEDKQILEAIREGHIQTKTFDFDGEKYEKEEAERILTKLTGEIEAQKEQITILENQGLALGYKQAKKKGLEDEFKSRLKTYGQLMDKVNASDNFRIRIDHILKYVRENAPFDEYKLIPVENKLDELYEDVKNEWGSIAEIVLPAKILELEIGDSFQQFVLNEDLRSTGRGNFNGENFNQFYNQIYLINERINRACINYLRDFIYFQGDLFKA